MRRPRNTEREQYVANKQARYLGMDPKDVLGLIDRKGGDYYRSDLFSDQGVMRQAEDDYSTFRSGTPAMNQVADDMRSYYGVGNSQVMTNLPPEIAAQVAAVSELYVKSQPATTQEPQPMRKPAPAPSVTPKKEKGLLRRAGEAIRSFDDAYAAKVGDLTDNPFVKMTSGFPVTYAPAGTMKEKAVGYGILGANVASRYALPAGGVTLAGVALNDLTQRMMDQQSSGTIDMQ